MPGTSPASLNVRLWERLIQMPVANLATRAASLALPVRSATPGNGSELGSKHVTLPRLDLVHAVQPNHEERVTEPLLNRVRCA